MKYNKWWVEVFDPISNETVNHFPKTLTEALTIAYSVRDKGYKFSIYKIVSGKHGELGYLHADETDI